MLYLCDEPAHVIHFTQTKLCAMRDLLKLLFCCIGCTRSIATLISKQKICIS